MSSPSPSEIAEVLDFWFGEVDQSGQASAERAARWWKKDPAFDAEISQRFGHLHELVAQGQREAWLEQPRGSLAAVIIVDQFSRNMFRDTPRMFEHDRQALSIALGAIEVGHDRALAGDMRAFMYMPLMHSEDLEYQDLCVQRLTELAETMPAPGRERIRGNLDFAHAHRDIIARFGRFPHRNAILGRMTTREEAEFLTQPGSSF